MITESQRDIIANKLINIDINKIINNKMIMKVKHDDICTILENEQIKDLFNTIISGVNEDFTEVAKSILLQAQQTRGNKELNFAIAMNLFLLHIIYTGFAVDPADLEWELEEYENKAQAHAEQLEKKQPDITERMYIKGMRDMLTKVKNKLGIFFK